MASISQADFPSDLTGLRNSRRQKPFFECAFVIPSSERQTPTPKGPFSSKKGKQLGSSQLKEGHSPKQVGQAPQGSWPSSYIPKVRLGLGGHAHKDARQNSFHIGLQSLT